MRAPRFLQKVSLHITEHKKKEAQDLSLAPYYRSKKLVKKSVVRNRQNYAI